MAREVKSNAVTGSNAVTKSNKKSSEIAPAFNEAISNKYASEIESLVRQYYYAVKKSAIESFVRNGDFAELTAQELLARAGWDNQVLAKKTNAVAESFVLKIQNGIDAKLRQGYAQAGKQLPPILSVTPRILNIQQKNMINQQVTKIKDLLDYQYKRINDVVQSAVVEKKGITQLMKELKTTKIFEKQDKAGKTPKIYSGNVSKRIGWVANNQLNYATSMLWKDRSEELGLYLHIWKHPPKSHYKTEGRPSHIAMNGKQFDIRKGALIEGKRIQPAQLINCYPESTSIQFADRIEKSFSRWFSGELSVISTTTTSTKATPNHPILTNRGWIRANEIQVGDYIFEVDRSKSVRSNSNINNTIPTISDIFNSMRSNNTSRIVSLCAISNLHFHSENIINEKVNIIDANSKLRYNIFKLQFSQRIKLFFAIAMKYFTLTMLCSIAKFGYRVFITFQSFISNSCSFFSLFNIHRCITNNRSLALCSNMNAVIRKQFGYTPSGNVIFSGDSGRSHQVNRVINNNIVSNIFIEDAIDCDIDVILNDLRSNGIFVKSSMVTNTSCESFSGHVYNLQTEKGYYIADNIITHNCKCYSTVYIAGYD